MSDVAIIAANIVSGEIKKMMVFCTGAIFAIVHISEIISGGKMSDRKAVIKNADMSEEMQQVKQLYCSTNPKRTYY